MPQSQGPGSITLPSGPYRVPDAAAPGPGSWHAPPRSGREAPHLGRVHHYCPIPPGRRGGAVSGGPGPSRPAWQRTRYMVPSANQACPISSGAVSRFPPTHGPSYTAPVGKKATPQPWGLPADHPPSYRVPSTKVKRSERTALRPSSRSSPRGSRWRCVPPSMGRRVRAQRKIPALLDASFRRAGAVQVAPDPGGGPPRLLCTARQQVARGSLVRGLAPGRVRAAGAHRCPGALAATSEHPDVQVGAEVIVVDGCAVVGLNERQVGRRAPPQPSMVPADSCVAAIQISSLWRQDGRSWRRFVLR